MAVTIGSNISSLIAQRRLSQSTSQLSQTFERLSSGQRINRAADDAAGLAISESLKSDRRVFNQGVRNFNDGLSLLNIADSAMDNLTNILVRLKELSEQSANGTYSSTQRAAIDKEAQALSKEFTRIVQTSKFNGVGILNGDMGGGINLQGGYGLSGGIQSGVGGAIGTGQFTQHSLTSVGAGAYGLAEGDFNGDGLKDLATANYGNNSINILLSRGDGTFSSAQSLSSTSGIWGITAGDFNGDGVTDLVSANQTNSSLRIFTGRGDGTFTETASYSAFGITPYEVVAADFNNDGNLDLSAVGFNAANALVYLGSGNGSFSYSNSFAVAGPPFALSANPWAVTSGDLNSDGNMDLVATDTHSNTINVLLGNGSGSFASRVTYSTGSQSYDVTTADLNGDGVLDVITGNYDTDNITIFMGRGNGSLSAGISIAAGDAVYSVDTGDVNGDGNVDLISSGFNSNTVDVFLGNGNGSFASRVSYASAAGPSTVLLGDFTGDGVLDITVAGYSSNNLRLFKGASEQGTSPIESFSLRTAYEAKNSIVAFDKKLTSLLSQRGQIGAFQSRIQIGINNLQTASENYAAAESRIRDVDVATESSELTRLNILQRAASSVLAQANLQPELALRLLQS